MAAAKGNKYAEGNNGGRPTKYKDEFAEQAFKLCSVMGADDKKLAEFFEVEEKTINNWKIEHEEFLQSIRKGKDLHDSNNVEASLLKRALGYKVLKKKFATHEGSISDEVEYEEEIPPDTRAITLWLTNRNPERWKVKTVVENESSEDSQIVDELENQNPDTLKKLRDSLKKLK